MIWIILGIINTVLGVICGLNSYKYYPSVFREFQETGTLGEVIITSSCFKANSNSTYFLTGIDSDRVGMVSYIPMVKKSNVERGVPYRVYYRPIGDYIMGRIAEAETYGYEFIFVDTDLYENEVPKTRLKAVLNDPFTVFGALCFIMAFISFLTA